MSGAHLSKEFFELIKQIGESKSKQEEDRILKTEIQILKNKIQNHEGSKDSSSISSVTTSSKGLHLLSSNSKKKQREFLVRLLYVEMLGWDGAFGYMKAVEMAASTQVSHKKLGYLLCSVCLNPDHDFRFLLVNQLQRDLQSSHVLEAGAALIALNHLATKEMVPALANLVKQTLDHGSEMIRKKAVVTYYKLFSLDPETIDEEDFVICLRKILCDRDPGVMGASLYIIDTMAMEHVAPFKDLVPSLISILKQIMEHRLPREYDYHRMPAPFLQIALLRILRTIGKGDNTASQGMYEIVGECLKRADIGINMGYAVVYECVRTITAIYPNAVLLDAAADAIARFISSKNHNLKYLGVTGLAAIVESHPKYAASHQLAVMDCLESPDITLAFRTLELLYRMTNTQNVEFIVEKLLEFLKGGKDLHSDEHLQKDLTFKIANLAERFAPSNDWYVETISQLLEISGGAASCEQGLAKVANQLMQLIAEGDAGGEDDEFDDSADISLRRSTVNSYISILLSANKSMLHYPDVFVQMMCWVLGEYGYLADKMSVEAILERLTQLAVKRRTAAIGGADESTMSKNTTRYILQAIFKLVAQAGTCPHSATQLIQDYTFSRDVELQQRCREFLNIIQNEGDIIGEILPIDASCEDLGDDIESLNFLNSFVQEKLNAGAVPYSPPEDFDDEDYDGPAAQQTSFNLTPYEKPSDINSSTAAAKVYGQQHGSMGSLSGGGHELQQYGVSQGYQNTSTQQQVDSNGQPTLNLRNAASVWGKPMGGNDTPGAASSQPTPTMQPIVSPSNIAPMQTNPYTASPPSTFTTNEPESPRELTEKEKMAAALFGGVGGSTASSSAAAARAKRRGKAANPTASTSTNGDPDSEQLENIYQGDGATAPGSSTGMDLLDMGGMVDSLPTDTAPPVTDAFGSSTPAAVPSGYDTFGTSSINADNIEQEIPVVPEGEKISDQQPEKVAMPSIVDPFEAEGLIKNITQQPPPAFNYHGNSIKPLMMDTPSFGSNWGILPKQVCCSVSVSSALTLDEFMSALSETGFHLVEVINATNEGIAAGQVGPCSVLLHGKVDSSTPCVLTFKSSDETIANLVSEHISAYIRDRVA